MSNPFETLIADEEGNLFYEQVAKTSPESHEFVNEIKILRHSLEMSSGSFGCTRIEMLMSALDYEFKLLNISCPRTREESIACVEPLIEMLQEGIVIDASFFDRLKNAKTKSAPSNS